MEPTKVQLHYLHNGYSYSHERGVLVKSSKMVMRYILRPITERSSGKLRS